MSRKKGESEEVSAKRESVKAAAYITTKWCDKDETVLMHQVETMKKYLYNIEIRNNFLSEHVRGQQ